MKECGVCGQEFVPYRMGWARYCSYDCRQAAIKVYMSARYRRLGDTEQRKYRYAEVGYTLEDYQSLEVKQQGKCAICGQPETGKRATRLTLDHNHYTGEVRGLLCGSCNLALGKFKDSLTLLEAAAEYLRKAGTSN